MLEMLPYPLHPIVVHFPIALFVTALISELGSWITKKDMFHQTAVIVYVFAALISPLVLRTGLWEAQQLNLNHPVLDNHRLFATWLMWTTLMSLPVLYFFAKQYPKACRVLFILFVIGAVALVSLTGHFGGRMVYEYGVGTN